MNVLTLANVDELSGGSNQALLLAEHLKTPILNISFIASDKMLKTKFRGLEVYHPSKSYLKAISELNPDVLFVHWLPPQMIGEMEKIKEYCKVVYVMHANIYELLITDSIRNNIHFLIEFLNYCDSIICLSEKQRAIVSLLTQTKVKTIPPAIEYNKLSGIECHAPSNDLIMVGGLRPIKNHLTPFLAMRHVRKELPNDDVFLRVYDEGMLLNDYGMLISRLMLTDCIGLFGHVPHKQLLSAMCMCKALICSSFNENLSVAVLEARALGLPIIREDPFSPKDYANRIIEVISNYDSHKEKAEKDRERMKAFDVGVIKKQHLKEFKSVL